MWAAHPVLTENCSCRVILETDATTIAGRVAMRGPDDQMSISEQVSSPITSCIATVTDPNWEGTVKEMYIPQAWTGVFIVQFPTGSLPVLGVVRSSGIWLLQC